MAAKGAHARRKIVEFLQKEHVATFTEIKEYVNSQLKHGITTGRLNNILGKDPGFVKVGMTELKAFYLQADGNGWKVTEWTLAD